MKTFVINLERSVERRKHVVRHLKKRKIDYELIKAVDGKLLSEEERERLCDIEALRARNRLTDGIIGCALSHLNVYRRMVEEKIEIALVLEDDIILPRNIKQILKLVESNIKPGEVIMLHYCGVLPLAPILSKADVTPLDNRYSLLYPHEFPYSTAGYVIRLETARALSEMLSPIRVEADEWQHFYNCGAIKSLRCVYPRPLEITQAETEVQVYNYQGITFRHRVLRIINGNKIPLLYPLACAYLRMKDRRLKIKLVDEPSPIVKQPVKAASAAAVTKTAAASK